MSERPAPDPRVVRTRKDVLGAATDLLFDEGLDAVTHRQVALASGYSRATIYAHWPSQADLLVDAFTPFADIHHPEPTGDLRTDLVRDLMEFRRIMLEHRVDRALALLIDLTASVPGLLEVRERVASEGERLVRRLLGEVTQGDELDAAAHMLVGIFLNSALMHGEVPSERLIETAIDLVLRGLGQSTP